MALGSIVWRCRICGNKSTGRCAHPTASYSIIYTVNKRQKWQSVGRNRQIAEKRLNEVVGQIHEGTYHTPQRRTFREFAEQWLQDYASVTVKPLTYRSYRQIVAKHLNPAFGHKLLSEITTQEIQRLLAAIVTTKHLSPSTANHALVLLKHMLTDARRWKLLRENPAQDVKRLKEARQEMDFLTPAELRLLLQHADEPYRTLFLTAALTGMRRGELLGLQWGDIDWRQNLIYVRRSIYWQMKKELPAADGTPTPRWRFSEPKSDRSMRKVIMSPRLREALELHRLICPVSPDELIFCNKQGKPLEPYGVYKREFLSALTRAGLHKIRLHDLRHTFASLLIAQGENVKFVQSQLGHASAQFTLDRYTHLMPDQHQAAGQRLDEQVFGAPQQLVPHPVGDAAANHPLQSVSP